MHEKKSGSQLKTFKRVLIIHGVIAALILVHLFIFFAFPFIMEMHGF